MRIKGIKFTMSKKKGQVWIETVIYTLIGISLIALVLAFVMPKLNEKKDKLVIEQAAGALRELESKIDETIENPPLNRRLS